MTTSELVINLKDMKNELLHNNSIVIESSTENIEFISNILDNLTNLVEIEEIINNPILDTNIEKKLDIIKSIIRS